MADGAKEKEREPTFILGIYLSPAVRSAGSIMQFGRRTNVSSWLPSSCYCTPVLQI